jgi:hypothetical protein
MMKLCSFTTEKHTVFIKGREEEVEGLRLLLLSELENKGQEEEEKRMPSSYPTMRYRTRDRNRSR